MRELVLEESVTGGESVGARGDEDCALIGIVAEDRGHFDDVSFVEQAMRQVCDKVIVDNWTIHVQGWMLGARISEIRCVSHYGSLLQDKTYGIFVFTACMSSTCNLRKHAKVSGLRAQSVRSTRWSY